jgi:hypothetical protein
MNPHGSRGFTLDPRSSGVADLQHLVRSPRLGGIEPLVLVHGHALEAPAGRLEPREVRAFVCVSLLADDLAGDCPRRGLSPLSSNPSAATSRSRA